MRNAAVVAMLLLAGLAPRVSLAQLRSVVDEEPRATKIATGPAAVSAKDEWEGALADRIVDAGTWSGIGQRLYAAGLYRESIVAFEQSFVHRMGRSADDARCIAEAYAKRQQLKSFEDMTVTDAVAIGLGQCLALVPGSSRSGSTIMAALFRRILAFATIVHGSTAALSP